MIRDDSGAPEGGALPLVLGGPDRDAEQLLEDLRPFLEIPHMVRAAAIGAAYVVIALLAFVGAAHLARTVTGIAG